MKLKTYQAYTMAEALAAVKRDLGNTAVILHTRSFKRKSWLGLRRRTIVEVTATIGEHPKKGAMRSSSGRMAQRAYGATGAGTSNPASGAEPKKSISPAAVAAEDRERTRRLARLLAAKYETKQAAGRADAPDDESAPAPAAPQHVDASAAAANEATPAPDEPTSVAPPRVRETSVPHEPAQRFILTPARVTDENGAGNSEATPEQRSPAAPAVARVHDDRVADDDREGRTRLATLFTEPNRAAVDSPGASGGHNRESLAIEEELTAIRRMVGQVLQKQTVIGGGASTPTMPSKLFDMYLALLSQDLSEELADRIINDVRDELTVAELEDHDRVRAAVMRHLSDYIPIADEAVPRRSPDSKPLTIALVGPTGVGKTTTLAKLAASFKLRHGRRVGLITSDTYRIAAVDQLRTYANIIGLPLKVALTPAEMRQCVHALRDCDVVLIDTAGRSQNDASRLEELQKFIAAAEPHEVHLVLSGTASEKVLLREAEAFSPVGVSKIVLTKLDEAVSFGMLVNVVRSLGKELSFFTTGQEVPDHLEIGRPERLAELILGGKVHS